MKKNFFNKSPIYLAVKKEYIDIIKLLISQNNLDINLGYVFIL